MKKIFGIILLVLMTILIIGCIGSSLDEASAKQTYTSLCNAVKNKDFAELYTMTSSQFKVRMSQENMIKDITTGLDWRSDPIASTGMMGGMHQKMDYSSGKVNISQCTIEAISIQKSPKNDMSMAEARITWTFDSGQKFIGKPILNSENGAWKIESYGIPWGFGAEPNIK